MTPLDHRARLIAARERLGLSQAAMAARLETSLKTYGQWERGARRTPGIAAVAAEMLVAAVSAPPASAPLPRWAPVTLSARAVKTMDRLTGCELVMPWPKGLPAGDESLALDEERDATPAERAAAEQILADACRTHDLTIVRAAAAMMKRPPQLPRPYAIEQHLVAVLLGRRWIGARHAGVDPLIRWYPAPSITIA